MADAVTDALAELLGDTDELGVSDTVTDVDSVALPEAELDGVCTIRELRGNQ